MSDSHDFNMSAEGETRTPTEDPPLDPEPSASTSSATSAQKNFQFEIVDLMLKMFYIYSFIIHVK